MENPTSNVPRAYLRGRSSIAYWEIYYFEKDAPAVRTLSWYITGLQVLYITSLVTYYKQLTDSLHEQGTQKTIGIKNLCSV